jgi:Tfp pilus assembly protein PilF
MLCSSLVLAAALTTQTPDAPPADNAVRSVDLPAGNPSAAQGAIDRGLAAFKKRRFTTASADFQQAVEADPTSAGPYFYLGYTYYKLAEKKRPFHPDKEKARQMFAKAYSIDPAFQPVWREKTR